ncbi:MAG: hypothetical protein Q9208_001776 [Pyrenodesmia sp. 3 TL-2023]
MPFFKELRRRRTSAKANNTPPNGSSTSTESNGTVPTTKSSSTLSSFYGANSTPASSIQPHQSTPNLNLTSTASKLSNNISQPPQRPVALGQGMAGNRNSVAGMSIQSISSGPASKQQTSAFAPRVLSVTDNSWVNQKVLLVYGQVADPTQQAFDGTLTVCHHQDNFPPTTWPVSESHFKALVHLFPGPNRIRFDFTSPKIVSNNSSIPVHCSWMNINYLPATTSPPVQLVILLGKDSPGTFDAVPERMQREGNDLGTAIRKFRMAAYLWQAFTGEQMYRNGFGRRCFRFEEEWQSGTLTFRDRDSGQMRSEAKIHVVRSEKTVKELRDLNVAQQYEKAAHRGDLFSIAMGAMKSHFKPTPGQKQYVSVLLLDAHWDTKAKTITGVIVTAPTGVAFVELFSGDDGICHTWIEYGNGDGLSGGPPRQIVLTENDLWSRMVEEKKGKKLKLSIHSVGQGSHNVEDFGQLVSKSSVVKLPNGQTGFRGSQLGTSQQAGSQPQQIILDSAIKQRSLLTSIKVYHGFAVDGLEFCYEDLSSQLFGKRGGQPGGSEFFLDTRRGEVMMGFNLRSGLWVDGIEILTSLGRKSGMYGNPTGGSG